MKVIGSEDKGTDTAALLALRDSSSLTCRVELADRGSDAMVPSSNLVDAATETEAQGAVPLEQLSALFEDLRTVLRGEGDTGGWVSVCRIVIVRVATAVAEERLGLQTIDSSAAMQRLQQLVREVGLAAHSTSRELQLQAKVATFF